MVRGEQAARCDLNSSEGGQTSPTFTDQSPHGIKMSRQPTVQRLTIACSALLWAWPAASRADTVDIPELGIQIPGLPSNLDRPRVIRRFDGYYALLHIGTAKLSISRPEDPVSSDSDVRKAAYRASLEADLGRDLGPKAHGRATAVNGHSAWTTFTIGPSNNPNRFIYVSTTYVTVDQHLYWFWAQAVGGDKRPPDFDAALQAISDLKFAPVDRSSMQNVAPPQGLLRMPSFHVASNADYYPAVSKRGGVQGKVEFEYSINAKGHVADVRQGEATSEDLAKSARRLLESVVFQVKPGWEESGYDKLRFPFEVQFWLGIPGPCPEDVPPKVVDAVVVSVCSTPLRYK
jgi:hypothetical protein